MLINGQYYLTDNFLYYDLYISIFINDFFGFVDLNRVVVNISTFNFVIFKTIILIFIK